MYSISKPTIESLAFMSGLLFTQVFAFIRHIQKNPLDIFPQADRTQLFPVPPLQPRKIGRNKLLNEVTFSSCNQV